MPEIDPARAQKLFSAAIGPAPWYWETFPKFRSRSGQEFIWTHHGTEGPLAHLVTLGLAQESEKIRLALNTYCRPFLVPPDLLGIWCPEGRNLRFACFSLMAEIADFPAPVYAAISGYCMGGGLDLALACHHRIASPDSIFGHRGAALGLITGWGGTQRLPRLIGRGRALQMFVAAEKLNANDAMGLGLVDAIHENPVVAAIAVMSRIRRPNRTE